MIATCPYCGDVAAEDLKARNAELAALVVSLREENARLRGGLEAMRDGCRECSGDGDVVEAGGPFGTQNVVCMACRPAQAALGGWDA